MLFRSQSWKKPIALERECIAQMFEALADGGLRRDAMEKYFPNAFGYFESYLRSLL